MLESLRKEPLTATFGREWVGESLENPLTVVLIWVSVLIPWNIGFITQKYDLYYVRWAYLEFGNLFRGPGTEILLVNQAYEFQTGNGLFTTGYLIWGIGTAVFTIAVLYSIALFMFEDRVAPFARPARVGGVLLTVTGGAFLLATAFIYQFGLPSIQIPLGAFMLVFFGYVLLTNSPEETGEDPHIIDR
ncbi:DUF7549 family protein [Salinibaculum rarum]|uniref:DUF7549 family protein n=1 Tax=Salinibaculum rarum TaxID=3058903 RepID=UPI00265F2AA3|nr:hypothetical protein [Salinibaculum sp. KK48]